MQFAIEKREDRLLLVGCFQAQKHTWDTQMLAFLRNQTSIFEWFLDTHVFYLCAYFMQ